MDSMLKRDAELLSAKKEDFAFFFSAEKS